jgi:Fur family transcriptional regulator, ferric uptake regulator
MSTDLFHRNTRQRQVLLEELCKVTSHPTASELYEIVRQRLPSVSLGTVYRNLDLLARMGMIQKLERADGEARFDGNTERHDHVRCVRCGAVADVDGPPVAVVPEGKIDFRGYELLGHRLEFVGICPRCRKQPSSDPTDSTKGNRDHA